MLITQAERIARLKREAAEYLEMRRQAVPNRIDVVKLDDKLCGILIDIQLLDPHN